MKKFAQFITESKGIYKIDLEDLILDEFVDQNLPYKTNYGRIGREERLRKILLKKYISFYYDCRGDSIKDSERAEWCKQLISGVCEGVKFEEEVMLNNKPVRDLLTVTIKHVDEDNEIFNYNLDWTKPVTINTIRKITKRFDL